jgi:hypothetical protein
MASVRTMLRVRLAAVLLALSCAVPAPARAQTLTVDGDRFAIDGAPRFLTFMSMFGAMDAPDIGADLRMLAAFGFDGFRIWPNLHARLFAADGTVKPEGLARLVDIVDRARAERLVVDVTFTYEHTPGLTPAGARLAIGHVARSLRGYDNLLFDIQNERNVRDRRYMTESDVAHVLSAINAIDPARIVVASTSPADTPAHAAAFTERLGLDATAYHEPRSADWYTAASVRAVVRAMKASGRPAYLQEPMRTWDSRGNRAGRDRAEYFVEARSNARLAGAAAWCFHTDVALDYRAGPPSLAERLRARPDVEWAFVNALRAGADGNR